MKQFWMPFKLDNKDNIDIIDISYSTSGRYWPHFQISKTKFQILWVHLLF